MVTVYALCNVFTFNFRKRYFKTEIGYMNFDFYF